MNVEKRRKSISVRLDEETHKRLMIIKLYSGKILQTLTVEAIEYWLKHGNGVVCYARGADLSKWYSFKVDIDLYKRLQDVKYSGSSMLQTITDVVYNAVVFWLDRDEAKEIYKKSEAAGINQSYIWSEEVETNSLVEKKEISLSEPTSVSSTNYWWLNANPKFWSMAEWVVGEEQDYTLLNANGHKRRIYQNFIDAKVGDLIICYESTPTKQILCLAEVSQENDGERIYFRKTETLANPVDLESFKDVPELQEMEFMVNPNGSFFKLTSDEFNVLMDIIREANDKPVVSSKIEVYTDADFLDEVYMSEDDYVRLKSQLLLKKNIILQGAPGVGKTFSAKRLAYSIMGEKDDSRICVVQFHQNYSYEDFVEGYKPDDCGFKLRKGIFYNFCMEAKNNPQKEYFFIIDEINRGNMSKIFGELLMLIEKDYRGEKMRLAYSGENFYVPKNLHMIGMMNTADRSLAMIDYALRRRFSFFSLKPGFESEGFKKQQAVLNNEKFNRLVSEIIELNKEIINDDSLGAGFEIGHSYLCFKEVGVVSNEWLYAVVHFDVIPQLQEYWFDNNSNVNRWAERLTSAIND